MTEDELEELREQRREKLETELTEPSVPDDPIYVDGADHFQELVESYDVVLVDFYADWCGPCQMLEPHVNALAGETDAAVLKVDIDEHEDLAAQHQVRGVPTLVVYRDGSVADRATGMQERDSLRALVQ